jgi:hypothetical protein
MSDEIMEGGTDNAVDESQEANQGGDNSDQVYTKSEFDAAMAKLRRSEQKKFERKLEGIDLEEARLLKQEKEQADLELQKKRGEFEKILKSTVEKKDARIQQLEARLQQQLIDGELLNAASRHSAVSPEQVAALLRNKTRLDETGNVEVLDDNGSHRYNDSGESLTVGELVGEFLTANPHFVRATTGGTGSMGKAGGSTQKPASVEDMLANWSNGGKEAYAALKKGKK